MKEDKRYKGKQGGGGREKSPGVFKDFYKGYTLADISGISDDTEFSDVKAMSY